MAASYPGSVKSFTTKTNYVDLVDASHVNDLQDEVVAIETELGTDVAGSATNLKTRLAVSLANDGSIQGGSSFPGSPVGDQLFVRTDEDALYRRNTGNTSWELLSGIAEYTDGTLVECTAATEQTDNSTGDWELAKQLSPLIRGGTITVQWEHDGVTGAGTQYTKLYINSVAVGTNKTPEDAYTTVSETGVSVDAGDIIQIYVYAQTGGTVKVKNLQILCDNPTIPTEESGY